jgi:CubicO group peptidase (beta-lactamase class C family)
MSRLVSLAVTVVALGAQAQQCRTRASWPTRAWPEAPLNREAKSAEVQALEAFAFSLTGKPEERKGYRTNALVVVKNGAIVYEKYARGWDAAKRHLSWSVAKSISSTLVGVAAHQGLLDVNDSVCKHLPEYAGDPVVCDITVKHFLEFGSGLQWQEEYEDRSYQVSSVIAMLFGVGRRDQVRHVLTHRKLHAPGSTFVYSTGDAHVVATIAKKALTAKHGPDAFWSQLFDKLGMAAPVFEEDVSGNALGGSFVYATPRDFAKVGFLMLNDGCWSDERLLPAGWVQRATAVSDTFRASRGDCSGATLPDDTYRLPCEDTPNGSMWWLNRPPATGVEKPWKDAPDDTYAALGHWGQRIIVIPSEDLVIVRTGDDREGSIPVNELVKFVLPLVRP